MEVVIHPHLHLEPLPDEGHLVRPVLGGQILLPLLLVLAAGVEVDVLVLHVLVPSVVVGGGVLGWRGRDLLHGGHGKHWLAVIGRGLGWHGRAHLHGDQGALLNNEFSENQSFDGIAGNRNRVKSDSKKSKEFRLTFNYLQDVSDC